MKTLSKKLICRSEINLLDFKVRYMLYERTNANNEKSFDIRTVKMSNDNLQHNKILEEATVLNIEWRSNEAQRIFDTAVKNSVTPMCLEDAVLELI